ncbi:hypothetical protein [Bradyrhizobium elkanii]|uniref:hypothetical protein n=1 Tax=Bradyrhizobium elkanii TaxID=29448 RepID=UPI0012FDABDF|nr:hypothetical protein [Bradyrhizobium elkanii]WLA79601.1 hypothetical protein QNJ99_29920 [Bradyrhizobium elkanii]
MAAATKARHKAAESRERNRKVKIVQSEKDAPMKLSEMEQKLADTSKQFRAYMRSKRAELKAMLQGPQGKHWHELVQRLRSLTIEESEPLIDYVKKARWLLDADLHTRQVALALIAGVIIRIREENGYSPADDALPGEPPTAFEIIRDELKVMT